MYIKLYLHDNKQYGWDQGNMSQKVRKMWGWHV